MNYLKFYRGLLGVCAFVLLKGDSCDGEVKSQSTVQCNAEGELVMEIGRGDCLGFVKSCTDNVSALYSSSDYLAEANWNGVDWLELRPNGDANYEVCVVDDAPLSGVADGTITVEPRDKSATSITLNVGVTVLGWDFHVEAPSLTDNIVEPDTRLRIQSIVVGRSGIVGFDFRSEWISTRPCDQPIKVPQIRESNFEWLDTNSEQYWATLYAPVNAQVGCHRIYGIVTSKGSTIGKADSIDVSVRPKIRAVIDYDKSAFAPFVDDVMLGSAQSVPSDVLVDWNVMHRYEPSDDWEAPPHTLQDGGRSFVLDYVMNGQYKISLTVTDPRDPDLTDSTSVEIDVTY